MRKVKKKLIIIGAVIILISGAFVTVGRVRSKPDKKPDRIEIVRRGPFVAKLNERGNLEPLIKVDVRSNVEGEIEKLYVDEGYDVVKGQKLLKIDEKQIREDYNQSRANYDAALAEMNRTEENIKLSSGKLKSDIQLAESSLKSSEANLEGTKARAEQQRSQARISISNTEDSLEQDKITLKKAQLALEQAESAEKSAKARLDNAKSELDRKKELYDKKFVSLQEVENAQLAYSSAVSDHESAQKSIQSQRESHQSQQKSIDNRKMRLQAEKDDLQILEQSLTKQIRQAEIQIEQSKERLSILKESQDSEQQITELTKDGAKANLLRAESVLNNAKERLDWTTVIAPMTGRVVQCRIEEGEIITSGRSAWSQGPPVMIIADLSKMIVKSYIHELDIGKIEVGQKVEIKIEAYPDEIFEGEVKEISPSGQALDSIIKFEVMIIVTKAPKPLLPGMTAYVDIIYDERDNVLQLPIEAVNPKDTVKIKTYIKNDMLSKLRNQDVKIAISSHPDKTFEAKVSEIAPARQGFSSSEVTIFLKETPKELQLDTSRTANLIMSDEEQIPNIEARIYSEKEYYVKLVKEEVAISTNEEKVKGKEKEKEKQEEDKLIQIGERNQNSIEILDGLKEDDRIRVVPVGEEEGKKKD